MNSEGTLDGFQGRINYFHRDKKKGIIGDNLMI